MNYLPIKDLCPNVGDRIHLREREVECTIIAHDPKDLMRPYLVGWVQEEADTAKKAGMTDSILHGGTADPRDITNCKYIQDITRYVFNEWISGGTSCALIRSSQSGMTCVGRHCGVFNEYAQPNQPDNTYLCYQCRQRPRFMSMPLQRKEE